MNWLLPNPFLKNSYALWIFLIAFFTFRSTQSYARKMEYQDRLTPLDLYALPEDAKHIINKSDLFVAIVGRGLNLKIATEDFNIAQENYHLAVAKYIPSGTLNSGISYDQKFFSGNESYAKSLSLGLAIIGDTPWGLNYSLDVPKLSQTITRTPSSEFPDSETNTVATGLTLTLNLLKGGVLFEGGIAQSTRDIDLETSKLSLRSQTMQALQQGETAFYDVLMKQIRVKVLELSLQSAKSLLSDITEMIKQGESDRLSSVKVELQYAQTQTDLLSAKSELASARQTLRDIVASPSVGMDLYPDPVELKSIPNKPSFTFDDAVKRAKGQRPDYLSALLKKQKDDLSLQVAFSKTLPKLDFVSSYGYSSSNNTFSEATSNTFKFQNPQYSIGFTFSYTLLNNTDRTNYTIAKINQLKAEYALQQLQSQIAKEVESQLQSVELGYQRLKTSELARSLSERKLQAEFEKFKVGESNIRNIIDFQTEVNTSRIAEVTARVDLFKNLSSLRTALGELPEGIKVRFKHD